MPDAFTRISPQQAKDLIEGGGVDVVDVREPHEWAGGHLAAARHLPLGQLLRDIAGGAPKDNVIFVCAHGQRSATAATAAANAGRKQVYSLEGGTVGWVRAGLPVVR
jgi:rhodanese-related sulfurtransferase